jgi:hypothetical protein
VAALAAMTALGRHALVENRLRRAGGSTPHDARGRSSSAATFRGGPTSTVGPTANATVRRRTGHSHSTPAQRGGARPTAVPLRRVSEHSTRQSVGMRILLRKPGPTSPSGDAFVELPRRPGASSKGVGRLTLLRPVGAVVAFASTQPPLEDGGASARPGEGPLLLSVAGYLRMLTTGARQRSSRMSAIAPASGR